MKKRSKKGVKKACRRKKGLYICTRKTAKLKESQAKKILEKLIEN